MSLPSLIKSHVFLFAFVLVWYLFRLKEKNLGRAQIGLL